MRLGEDVHARLRRSIEGEAKRERAHTEHCVRRHVARHGLPHDRVRWLQHNGDGQKRARVADPEAACRPTPIAVRKTGFDKTPVLCRTDERT